MAEALSLDKPLPIGGRHSTALWGLWTLVLTEGSLFGYLLLTYFYLAAQTAQPWPPEGHPKLLLPALNTLILLSSSIFVALSERALKRAQERISLLYRGIAVISGICFVAIQWNEWRRKPYGICTHLYGSLYYTITGFHMAHVVVGLIILLILMIWTKLGYLSKPGSNVMTIGGIYWHFVDAVWLIIFSSFYLLPYVPGM